LTVDLLGAPFFDRRFVAHRPIPRDLVADVIAQVLVARPTGGHRGRPRP
jgi:hypothetical protein